MPNDPQTAPEPKVYLLKKRNMWYRDNAQGYTSDFWDAGRFTKKEASEHSVTCYRGRHRYENNVYAVHIKKVVAGIERDLRCALQEASSLAQMLETIRAK